MPTVTLGRTGITTDKNAFGALPVQRVTKEEAAYLLRKAFDGGITFFDTARSYTDSEEKLGYAFKGMRDKLFIATKTPSTTPPSARSPGTAPAGMRPWRRPKSRGKSGLSA